MDILQVDLGSIFLLPKLYKILILDSYYCSLNYLHQFFKSYDFIVSRSLITGKLFFGNKQR